MWLQHQIPPNAAAHGHDTCFAMPQLLGVCGGHARARCITSATMQGGCDNEIAGSFSVRLTHTCLNSWPWWRVGGSHGWPLRCCVEIRLPAPHASPAHYEIWQYYPSTSRVHAKIQQSLRVQQQLRQDCWAFCSSCCSLSPGHMEKVSNRT